MRKDIPAPVIAVLSDNLSLLETHASLDNLFLYANAPGEPPEGSKPVKVQAWLRLINKESDEPLKILGKLIETYMELPKQEEEEVSLWGTNVTNHKKEFKKKLESILAQCNLTYINGGIVSDGSSAPSRSLSDLIKGRDIPSIEAEFTRALANVNSEPRESVSAACNILESIFKVYIADEQLEPPQKQDLQNVWKIVRGDLGFDPKLVQDDDLKRVLSGILSIVDGIGAFRTHASSAHGEGRVMYKLKPRHARLAIHSAHTIAIFVLETWDEKRKLAS
ncbi:abortive infection family protein [Vibrio metoecus]|uniref:abortive infection family protein n=1 Tax=Vibrio metoecus TaxID=1481663 RepID=UPI000BA90F10|nr:abortive infection family protein [Vibrio metoecus]PAR33845.1 ATP-dependent RNA helicase HrpA [Vibrio metoecus]PAR38627.1 ATP-dependent RNA helicase HrpA [Vibrio metoecus]